MLFKLVFTAEAKKEWDNLDFTLRAIFKQKLKERLHQPHVESSRLSGMKNCYKIKLRQAGYRLVYQVRDRKLVVTIIAVGKRERNQVYKAAIKRV